ncbi:MAG: ABC transporter substrate-binding protein [Deltaproteobacteria bacterium]|nr:ABC transporter substrate-binding protein [Deltaproteobacteria bacterium]
MVKRKPYRICFLTVVGFFLSASLTTQDGRAADRLLIATPARAMFSLPFIIGQAQGFYRGEGLEPGLVVMPPQLALQALISGDLDFASPFSSSTRAAVSGMPVRNVMVVMTATDHVLVVSPKIGRVEDLKGKILGVSSLKSTPDLETRLVLEKYGLKPDVDAKIVALGGGSGLRLAALQGGNVDGVMLSMPQNKMAGQMGFRELVFMKDLVKIPFVGLASNAQRIRNDPDYVARAIKATLKAIRFIKENKEETLKLMARELGIKERKVGGPVYDDAVQLYSDTGIPSEDSMMEDIAHARKIQGVRREVSIGEAADWSLARRALELLEKERKGTKR